MRLTFEGAAERYPAGVPESVAATLEHLFESFSDQEIGRVVLLQNCMSSVTGFESNGTACIERALAHGARAMTAAEALTEISRN